ncbi:MAG: acylphosphatase [Acidobacteriota bacterium]|nr:acylphosphatase [Acidobacteriota bacterium]
MRLPIAREFVVRGRVQGVGFRWFVKKAAFQLGVNGYVRNEADGCVFVYAVGTERQLSQLAGRLHHGPQSAEVRGVDERAAAVRKYETFEIEG